MDKLRKLNAVRFAVATFFPIFLLLFFYLAGLFLDISVSNSILHEHNNSFSYLLLAIGSIVYYFFLSAMSFRYYIATDDFKKRLFVMYISWMAASFPIIFLVVNGFGGASMAVAEGVAGSYFTRLPQYLFMTCIVILFGHILFVPWILIANWSFTSQYRSKIS